MTQCDSSRKAIGQCGHCLSPLPSDRQKVGMESQYGEPHS